MRMPGFSGEASFGRSGLYVRSTFSGTAPAAVVPQDFASCTTNRSCWGVVLMCRDHCERFDGSSHSSLWYVCGGCLGLFQEFLEFEF
jgi:hypothetical protein